MEHDLADDLDDLICSGPLNVENSDSSYWQKIGGLVFTIWISVATLVFLVANYLIESPPSDKNSTAESVVIHNDILQETDTIVEQSTEYENVLQKEVSSMNFSILINDSA